MKYLFLILVLMCGLNFAQQIEDVVYLKNGKIIWGVIIEQVPNKYIKIKSGKNVHVFQMGEIEKITKELSSTSIDISDKTWSVQAGLGTHRSFNLIAISKDFRIRKNGSFFLTAGIGHTVVGAGFCIQSDYNNNGWNFSSVFGHNTINVSLNVNLSYQWKIFDQGFLSAGINGGFYGDYYYIRRMYISTYSTYVLPTVAFDVRF